LLFKVLAFLLCIFLFKKTIDSTNGIVYCPNYSDKLKGGVMSEKTFILDTNVFLHDPSSIQSFGNNNIVISLTVLEELDNLKRRPDDRGVNARNVLRYIDSLKLQQTDSDFSKGIKIPQGPTVRIFLDIKNKKIDGFPLPLDSSSNRILSVAYSLKKEGENVIFVSKDFVSRVKAEAMGLAVEDYENLKVSYSGIQKGIRKFQVPKRDIDLFYKDGSIPFQKSNLYPNEYCLLTSEENSSAVCKYNQKKSVLEPIIHRKKGVWGIQPLNVEQKCVIDLLYRDEIQLVTLVGQAGTGKTLLALACGMAKVFDEGAYSRILVSRPVIPLGKDIGYLPGTKEEKLAHWMQPIYDNLDFLCRVNNGDDKAESTLEWIESSKKLEMEAVSYIRGRSLPKIYMIIDEAQNLTPHEMKTIISRAGKGPKVILTGDPTQIDNPYLDRDSNGLTYVVNRFRDQSIHGHVFLDKSERSKLAAIAAEIMS
jgi:PhoH-like ATPase